MSVLHLTLTEMSHCVDEWLAQRALLVAHPLTGATVPLLESLAQQLLSAQPSSDRALELTGEMSFADWAFDRCLRGLMLILEGYGELFPEQAELAEEAIEVIFQDQGLKATQLAYELELAEVRRMRARVAENAEVKQFLESLTLGGRSLVSWLEEAETHAQSLETMGKQREALDAEQPAVREIDARRAFVDLVGTLRRIIKTAGWSAEQQATFFAPLERYGKSEKKAEVG